MRSLKTMNVRRVATVLRWIAIGWVVVAGALLVLLNKGASWDDWFDDVFLIGALPAAFALLLAHLGERIGRDVPPSAPETPQ